MRRQWNKTGHEFITADTGGHGSSLWSFLLYKFESLCNKKPKNGGGVKSKGPSGADTLWAHSSASDPMLQLLWTSPGVLNWTHFSPRRWPIVHFPTNCWALLSDEFLTIRLSGQRGPSRQREWSARMIVVRRCWAHTHQEEWPLGLPG